MHIYILLFLEPLLNRMIQPPADTVVRVYLYDNNPTFQHFAVNHSRTFGAGLRHSNHIEGFWSMLKSVASFDAGANPRSVEDVNCTKFIKY
jgi:hypothetical protein